MNKFIFLIIAFFPTVLKADFGNYNSILIGERAAGMGGAYTALTDDPAASSFYNPAALARMQGMTLSAAVSVYNKYDTLYGDSGGFDSAALRVNRGSFDPIPSASGTVYTFHNFAFGLSIVSPDNNQYSGEIISTSSQTANLTINDTSLWVGGSLALNLSEHDAIGLTMYYTSRDYSKNFSDRITDANTTIYTEEKSFDNNSLVYILGYYRQLNANWSFGLSHRLPSVQVNGQGNYFYSTVSTSGAESSISESNLPATTKIPQKSTIGLGYEQPGRLAYSLDISYYHPESYIDLRSSQGDEFIDHQETFNINFGYENYLKQWLSFRLGLYSNISSMPEVSDSVSQRRPDHIDMWGFSANLAIHTSPKSSLTLGGYYTGGKGYSSQIVDGNIEKFEKSLQIFTLLVGTSFKL